MRRSYFLTGILLVFFFLIFSLLINASDIQLGGQINASLIGYYESELGFGFLPQVNLDIELFLPTWNHHEIKCAGYFFTDIAGGKIDFFWKKLYWEHIFENIYLSIGKKPISWSFGSLLNPVDYTLGAVALDRDYIGKYQNAMEIYFPINWNTSLSLVASLPSNSNDLKVGLRGRTLINNFDITANFIQEQLTIGEEKQKRFGITAKGDLGPFGVYSALGYYRKGKDSFSFLTGLDYSYFFQAGNQLYFQIEYLYVPSEVFSQIAGSLMFQEEKETDDNINLLVSNTSYQIDEFSSIGLTCLSNFSDGSKLIAPTYNHQIDTNTTFRIQAGVLMETKRKMNIDSLKSVFGEPSQLFVELGIKYSF